MHQKSFTQHKHSCRIPLASFESWDFGPKIGLDGLHGLAQVWTPLSPDGGIVGQESACAIQIWTPNCLVPLQIAQVQISTKLLEVSGMESKVTIYLQTKSALPKTLPEEFACRRTPAAGPPAPALRPLRRRAQR